MSARAMALDGRLLVGDGDEEVDWDEDERRALDAAIDTSLRQAASGRVAPAGDVLARLRARRRG